MTFAPTPTAAELFAEGARHHQAGRMAEAERFYRRALQADPRHADALHWLGVMAGEAGRPDIALQLIDQALAEKPLYSEAHTHRAVTLLALGRLPEAADSYRKAVSQKRDNAAAWYGLGGALRELNQLGESASAYRRAIALNPKWAEAHNNLAVTLQKHGRFEEAVTAYRKALALAPNYPQMHYNLGSALMAQRDLAGALACFDKALTLDPGYAEALGNRLLCLNYSPDVTPQALLDAHRDWERRYGGRAAQALANDRDPVRRLRIGFVSGDFQTHPIGYFLTQALEARDRTAVEVFCYSNDIFADAATARFQTLADHWRVIAQSNDEQAAAAIRQDRIDILFDLSGHTDKNRLGLFALKPAPLQASWLGYPGTIGLAAIDYLIMDADTVPPGAEAWFAEAVARMPHGRFCYAPPDYAPDVVVPPSSRPVTFGSFNNVTKVGPDVVRLWARVLQAVPGSRLLLKWKTLSERGVRHQLRAEFAAAGIDKNRVEWRASTPHPKMLAEYGDVDIALDPFPFCGGLTSAEALWMGVPVVTLPGDRPASRQTLGFLNQIGLRELAATSGDEYVRIATELAADPVRRAELRRGMRARISASPMCDGALQARGLEAAARQMWRRWCAGEAPATFDA